VKGVLIGLAWVVLGMVLVCSSRGFGETYTFTVPSGIWGDKENWAPNTGPPGSGDSAFIANGGSVDGQNIEVGPGSITLENGSVNIWGISINSRGWGLQKGGLLDTGNLWLGGENGSYELQAGEVRVAFDSIIGGEGTGTFVMSGGVYTTEDSLILGSSEGSEGNFSISDGSLSADFLTVGDDGTGTFTQTGGSVAVAYSLAVPHEPNAIGTYDLGGETLEFGTRLDIGTNDGRGGKGTFIVNGGSIIGTDYLYDSEIWVNGSDASLTGPGTYDTKVRYSSDWIYGDTWAYGPGSPFFIQFDKGSLTVGGQLTVEQITADDFAGGKAALLLDYSAYNVAFDGSFNGEAFIGIPYFRDDIDIHNDYSLGERAVHQTGPDTYEILDNSTLDGGWCYTYEDEFGNFAIQVWDPNLKLIDKPYLKRQEKLGLLQSRSLSEARLVDAVCTGAVADGETDIVFYIDLEAPALDTETPDWITISVLTIDGEDNGRMIGEGEDDDGDGYDDTPRISEGVFTQSWCVPEFFVRKTSSKYTEKTREIWIKIEYDPDKDGDVDYESTEQITLSRPPVLLVHGLWSSSSAFGDLANRLDAEGFRFVLSADYSGTNSASFAANAGVVPGMIRLALSLAHNSDFACEKIDTVGHSMGGVLMKRMGTNFASDNVRKMITIGSPYNGSQMADMLYNLETDNPLLFGFIDTLTQGLFHTLYSPLTSGAVKDLQVGVNPTATQIPGVDCEHIVAGLRDSSADGMLGAFMGLVMMATQKLTAEEAHEEVFGQGAGSDWIVTVDSQLGGASSPVPTPVMWHCTETFDPGFMSDVVNWLNQPAVLTGGAAASSLEQSVMSAQQASASATILQQQNSLNSYTPSGTIEILSPIEGQTLEAGGTLSINIQGTGDTVKVAGFGFFGTDSGGGVYDLPFVTDINLPDDAVGSTAQVVAVGLDANMVVTDQAEVNLIWDANVVLEDIIFGFGDTVVFDLMMYPDANHTLMLGPIGRFDNGDEHMLSVLAGTPNYVSSDETVAVVDTNGLLVAKGKGQCDITVTHSGINAKVTVVIDTYSGDISLDGKVNFRDFTLLAEYWQQPGSGLLADIWPESGDGIVNMFDLKMMCENWLAGVK